MEDHSTSAQLTSAPVLTPIGTRGHSQRDRRLPRRFMDPFVLSSSLVGGVEVPPSISTKAGAPHAGGRDNVNVGGRRAGTQINHSVAATARGRSRDLQKVKEEVAMLAHRVQALEHVENRLKRKLAERKEELKDVMTELQGTRTELILAEEKIEEMGVQLQLAGGEFEKYRRWWLTEYYSLKVVLELVSRRDNVEEIAAASRARFIAHSGSSQA
ncbi:hypothetical protein FA13DRAFT_1704097 [Coprinellus micaceus]|uniref:Uncharacterized protein n=1 Tax=Coprinellus micaceus TaxID=71717 RepID=A0A4Y7U136_COPMI|nr:hypothetical protein FA13DRAFT_1704097 [Coprinellus micaceus]